MRTNNTTFLLLALLLPSLCHSFSTQSQSLGPRKELNPGTPLIKKDCEPNEDVLTEDSSRRLLLSSMVVGIMAVSSDPSAAMAANINPTSESSSTLIPTLSTSNAANAAASTKPIDWNGIVKKASKRALGGGKAGATAAVVQVCSLMWLRTSMNYQYRYGGNLQSSLATLWEEGGVARLYQGLPFALLQGPLTRFGDTAANVGILALLESFDETRDLPVPLKTAFGSVAAGLWRILLMPIDASKTAMQVEGKEGLQRLWGSVLNNDDDGAGGPGALYRGALAQAAATAAGHYPWFATYNYLDANLPVFTDSNELLLTLARSAALGLGASCVSDCVSNSLRVIKTTKQTAQLGEGSEKELSYPEIVSMIVEKDGVTGLLGRGLQTRLLTNAIQGAVFSVLWKYFQQAS